MAHPCACLRSPRPRSGTIGTQDDHRAFPAYRIDDGIAQRQRARPVRVGGVRALPFDSHAIQVDFPCRPDVAVALLLPHSKTITADGAPVRLRRGRCVQARMRGAAGAGDGRHGLRQLRHRQRRHEQRRCRHRRGTECRPCPARNPDAGSPWSSRGRAHRSAGRRQAPAPVSARATR